LQHLLSKNANLVPNSDFENKARQIVEVMKNIVTNQPKTEILDDEGKQLLSSF
jgi:predicted small metal-binding protein